MKGVLAAAGLAAALLVANGLFSGGLIPGVSISPYFLQVICLAGINIVLAVSLNLINGFTGQFSIGHAGFMAIGAYSSAYFTVTFGERARDGAGLPAELRARGRAPAASGLLDRGAARGHRRIHRRRPVAAPARATTWPS